MAISINWPTKVIYVPKADLTLVQSSPTEIRQLNLNQFRMWLKDLEDGEAGMVWPDTHRHNTEVTVAGITLARVIEIINGYTVTFEDGQYAVNLVGANSNVGDVVNVNQVSVRTANSAGMTSSQDIEFASYENGVAVDVTSPYSGTLHPTGTRRQPVNNLTDALIIAAYRGLNTLFVIGDITVDTGGDYSGMSFIGESMTKSSIEIEADANVQEAEFYECYLTGVLDGQALAKNCRIGNLEYINGVIEQCVLEDGVITLGGGARALLLDCWSGSRTGVPTIDLGGSGQELSLRNYAGAIKLRNKSGTDPVGIVMAGGKVTLEATVTNGEVAIAGIGEVDNQSVGATVITSALLNPTVISQTVMASEIELGVSFKNLMRFVGATLAGVLSGADPGSTTITIKNVKDGGPGTKNRIVATVDQYGNRSALVFDVTD